MFTSGTAGKIYLKFTALFTAVLISVMFVFAPILPTLTELVGLEPLLKSWGIDLSFGNKTEKSYINVLLIGVDKSETLTDVMMIAQLNMVNNSMNILQIPRDTYINNTRNDKKLNSAYGSVSSDNIDDRVAKTMEEIQTLVDVEFDGYVLITTEGFRDVIDAVGGIEYIVPQDMNYEDAYQDLYIHLKKGQKITTGAEAEQLVRFRQYNMGDLDRINVQGDFIKEAMKQILEKSKLQSTEENNELLKTVGNMVSTNFGISDMLSFAPYVLKIDMEKVNIIRLEGTIEDGNGISYFIADKEKNEQIIYEYFSPNTTEVDGDELKIRDCVKESGAQTKQFNSIPESAPAEADTSVYLIDYSGTDGEALRTVRKSLTESGYNVINSVEARTCFSDKTYCISKVDGASARVANCLGINEYTYIPELDIGVEADVIVIIGKDI